MHVEVARAEPPRHVVQDVAVEIATARSCLVDAALGVAAGELGRIDVVPDLDVAARRRPAYQRRDAAARHGDDAARDRCGTPSSASGGTAPSTASRSPPPTARGRRRAGARASTIVSSSRSIAHSVAVELAAAPAAATGGAMPRAAAAARAGRRPWRRSRTRRARSRPAADGVPAVLDAFTPTASAARRPRDAARRACLRRQVGRRGAGSRSPRDSTERHRQRAGQPEPQRVDGPQVQLGERAAAQRREHALGHLEMIEAEPARVRIERQRVRRRSSGARYEKPP